MMDFIQAAQGAVATGEAAGAAAEVTRMGLWELFMNGGWLMWPLLLLGGVTVFIFVERFMAIRKASGLDMNFMNRIRDYISDGKIRAAVDLCRKTNTPIARMIEKGIERIGRPMGDIQTAIENVANLEVSKLENGLPFLATIAGGAPMIGFLGTVIGMVQTFMDMSAAGGTVDMSLLSGDYRGEIIVALHNDSNKSFIVEPQQRIAQMVVTPYIPISFVETDNLDETERGEGGFGSTGAKEIKSV